MPRFSVSNIEVENTYNQQSYNSIQPNQNPTETKWNAISVSLKGNNLGTSITNLTDTETQHPKSSFWGSIKRKITNSNQKTDSKKDATSCLTAKPSKENKKRFLAEIIDHMSKFINIPKENLRYIDIRQDPSEIETEILNYLICKGYSSSALQTKMESLKQKHGSKGLDYLLSKLTTKLIEHPNQYLIKNPACQTHPEINASQVESVKKTVETKNISDFEIYITKAYACLHPQKKIFITQNFFSLGVNHLYNNNNLPINDACNKALDIANKSRTVYEFVSYINSSEQNQHLLAENDQEDKDTTNQVQQDTKTPEVAEATREIPALENISLSPMTNLGNTCWCNATFKFMLHFFGVHSIKESINKKLHTCDTRTIIGMHRATVLNNLNIIFNDLSNNRPISQQIENFFIAINNYIQEIDVACSEEYFIKDIFRFISPAFAKKDKQTDFTKIGQEDAEAFFLHLSHLLGLVNGGNEIHQKKIKQFTFNNSDLKAIGISLSNDQLTLDIECPEDTLFVRTMNDKQMYTPQQEEITVKTFIEYLDRSTNTQSSKQFLLNIAHRAKNYDENIKISCKSVFKKTVPIVDMQQFTHFVLNVDSQHYNSNGYIRDIEKIKSFVIEAFQQSQMEVIDKNTQQRHTLLTQPSTIIIRKEIRSYRHYMTISIDSKQNFWVQNDKFNDSMENAFINTVTDCDQSKALAYFKSKNPLDQLLAFMKRIQAYPTSIGFFVV